MSDLNRRIEELRCVLYEFEDSPEWAGRLKKACYGWPPESRQIAIDMLRQPLEKSIWVIFGIAALFTDPEWDRMMQLMTDSSRPIYDLSPGTPYSPPMDGFQQTLRLAKASSAESLFKPRFSWAAMSFID